ncbi:hypothetical protein LTR95_012521 [Oleoguttula sp. CCFEE 5521]
MALRFPWLGELIEAELDEVVVWKTKVKHEPGTPRIALIGRLSDDGSNFRSLVDRSDLESQSELQIIRAYISKVGQCLVSDGQVQLRATLTPEAWSAYEAGLEPGQEPSQGDLICCKQFSVISTPFGPSDERVQVRIEQLEYVGKYRKTLGDPKPINQRPRVQQLLEEITRIRAEQDGDHAGHVFGPTATTRSSAASSAVGTTGNRSNKSNAEEDDRAGRSPSRRSRSGGPPQLVHVAQEGLLRSQQPPVASQERNSIASTTSEGMGTQRLGALQCNNTADSLPSLEVLPDAHLLHKVRGDSQERGGSTGGNGLLSLLTKTAKLPKKSAQLAFSTDPTSSSPAKKRRKLSHDPEVAPVTQTAFATQAANPRRRKKASLDHDGVGMAEGINNAGPLPPTSRRVEGVFAEQQVAAASNHSTPSPTHAVASRVIGIPTNDAPTSAQPTVPATALNPLPQLINAEQLPQPRRRSEVALAAGIVPLVPDNGSSLYQKGAPLRRHKIPADQVALLGAKSCHVPPMPGQRLPHPNVPIAMLQAWNAHRPSDDTLASSARQRKPIGTYGATSHRHSQSPMAITELQNVCPFASDSDESEQIPWSASPSQHALPLDSSAGAPMIADQVTPSRRPKHSLGSALTSGGRRSVTMRNGIFGVPGVQSPDRLARRSGDGKDATSRTADTLHKVSQITMRPSPDRHTSTQAKNGSAISLPSAPNPDNGPEFRGSNVSSRASVSSVSRSLRGNGSLRASSRPSGSDSVRARINEGVAPVNATTGPRLTWVPSLQARARTTSMLVSGSPQAVATQPNFAATQSNVHGFSQVVPSTNYETSARIQTAPSAARASPRRTNIGPDSHSQVPGRDRTSLSQPEDEAINHGGQRPSSASSLLSRSERFPSGRNTPTGLSGSQNSSSRARLNDAATITDRRELRLFNESISSQTPRTNHESAQRGISQVHSSRLTLVERSPIKSPTRVTIASVDWSQFSRSRPSSVAHVADTGSPASAGTSGISRSGSQSVPRRHPTWLRVGHPHQRTSGAELANPTSAQSSPAASMQDADHAQAGSSQDSGQRQDGHQRDQSDRSDGLRDGRQEIRHARGADTCRPNYGSPQPAVDSSRVPHPLPRKPATQTPNSSNDLPMEVPKPLDYREAHQERRRDFFRGEQRKQWLRERISPETSIVHVLPWLAEYHNSYPQDPVTAEQFAAVVGQLCTHLGPSEHGVLPETTSADTELRIGSPPMAITDELPRQADQFGNASQDTAEARISQLTNGQAISVVLSAKSLSRSSASQRSSRRSLPWAALPVEPSSTARQPTSPTQPEHGNPARHVDEVTLPTAEAFQDVCMRDITASDVSVFTEYARAWHATKPGGAFAKPTKAIPRPRAASRRLDVLSWGFRK